VGLEIPHESGALADLLIALGEGGVNVEYMYSFATSGGVAEIAFKTAQAEKAVEILKAAGAKVV